MKPELKNALTVTKEISHPPAVLAGTERQRNGWVSC